MRLAVLVAAIAMFGCDREPSLDVVATPDGWSRVQMREDELAHEPAIEALRLEYRERRTIVFETYEAPATGDRLRVIRLRSQYAAPTLLARLTGHRGPGVYRLDTVGQLAIDYLDTDDAHHVALSVVPEPSDDPDKVVRGSVVLASCIAGPRATQPPSEREAPCNRALAAAIDRAKDDASGSWLYWYVAGLAFAVLVIGRRLLVGRRLLPPKASGLPVARVR